MSYGFQYKIEISGRMYLLFFGNGGWFYWYRSDGVKLWHVATFRKKKS